jgi:hypothetical protein
MLVAPARPNGQAYKPDGIENPEDNAAFFQEFPRSRGALSSHEYAANSVEVPKLFLFKVSDPGQVSPR